MSVHVSAPQSSRAKAERVDPALPQLRLFEKLFENLCKF